jgi:hypothetical protein
VAQSNCATSEGVWNLERLGGDALISRLGYFREI